MAVIMRIAILSLLALAATGCNRRVAQPAGPAPQQEDWRPYDDLSSDGREWGALPRLRPAAGFDRVRSGMTLGEIVETLGRGDMWLKYEGIGIITWKCEDGRKVSVLPTTYRREEVILEDRSPIHRGWMHMTDKEGARFVAIPSK
jgi:hypothetical protein